MLNLREIRKEKGFTQKALAEASGSNQSSIARFEAKKIRPKPETAQRIAAILGFKWTEFYETEAADGEAETAATLG